jgi:hypothetical protein
MRSPNLSLLLLAAVAIPVVAQDTCLQQVKFPPVGRWAEYNALYNKKDPYTVRYAVIGSEKRGGRQLQWVELRMTGQHQDRNLIYQMLVPGSLVEMAEVQEIVFKTGDKPAMKMNGMMMKMIRDQLEKQNFFADVCKDVNLVGKEKVTVPAGDFDTYHYRSAEPGTDSWLAPGMTFSLIKIVGENHQMELSAQGSGAKSSITEQPQEMPGMGTRSGD